MNPQDLIPKLEAKGITLALCGQNLTYAADVPIPAGIMTTIEAHKPALIRHLKAGAPPERSEKPLADLEDLRRRAEAGELDGRPLVVLDYPHRDIGRVIREQLKHRDAAEAEGLNPGFFEDRLREIRLALEGEV